MKHCLLSFALLLSMVLTAQADIIFGVIPLEDENIMEQKFTPLCQTLSAEMGETVRLKVGANYDEIESGLVKGEIQAAYLGPVGAVKTNQSNSAIIPLVKMVKKGSPFYKSYIIAPKDTPLKSLADLKGKVFAFGDKGSTSSYLVPKYLLAKSGVKLDDLSEHLLTGSHSNVVRTVLEGKAAAGGVKESVALKNQDKLKFLEISKPIPNFPICANIKSLGKSKAKKMQRILTNMPKKAPEVTAISKKYDNFARATISDYGIIKAIMKQQ